MKLIRLSLLFALAFNFSACQEGSANQAGIENGQESITGEEDPVANQPESTIDDDDALNRPA
ncbi:MAG: hypothetical protein MJK18_15235, partial [Bdellovibrionales bacterium]|nr:hypothetical protein [Bdellovibrionales bacterium]